ncbi:hypothetical protein GmHk_09G025309 [Glycine max]|nr:hypothetical protein GmHk_09G025309 [Glycine max]
MPCFTPHPSLLFLLLTLLSISFFSPSTAARTSSFHSLRISDGVEDGGEGEYYHEVLPWKTRRSMAEEEATSNTSLILAQRRTTRKDPLDNYNHYTGGWNISNRHYIASVVFTAVPFFVVAAVWFVIFGLSLSFICLCYCCCPREPYGYSRLAYALSLIFLVLFTLAAIVGCVLLYTAQGKFHGSTTNTLKSLVSQADFTAENLRNVRRDLVILAAVMLFLAFLGFLFSIFGLQGLVYFLVIVGWILVAGTFILCGVFLFLHNVVADTCVAMDEWVQNPTAHTALDEILPCVDNATAQETLFRTRDVTHQLANLLGNIVSNVTNRNLPPAAGPLYYNQSGPLMPPLCNPFNNDLTNRSCADGEVSLDKAAENWWPLSLHVTLSLATVLCRSLLAGRRYLPPAATSDDQQCLPLHHSPPLIVPPPPYPDGIVLLHNCRSISLIDLSPSQTCCRRSSTFVVAPPLWLRLRCRSATVADPPLS